MFANLYSLLVSTFIYAVFLYVHITYGLWSPMCACYIIHSPVPQKPVFFVHLHMWGQFIPQWHLRDTERTNSIYYFNGETRKGDNSMEGINIKKKNGVMNEDTKEIIPRWISTSLFHQYEYITANTDLIFHPDVKHQLNYIVNGVFITFRDWPSCIIYFCTHFMLHNQTLFFAAILHAFLVFVLIHCCRNLFYHPDSNFPP
jgi:hypothetical protein